ncbi:TPA: hypothetical protein I9080_003478 [Clostridium perfringens]|uniref:Uncharacterized protein n=1 Tax=Clostridium perfringens TaxID=1502 RepID=A0A8H9R377_CLOPF|nr:hypothetical protein [Clostridium perfringens]HAT4315913.1 hypothetical protein [Clostridium perfringens]
MKIIKGMHIYKNKDGGFYIRGNKLYTWEVSKKLEEGNIEQGDIKKYKNLRKNKK